MGVAPEDQRYFTPPLRFVPPAADGRGRAALPHAYGSDVPSQCLRGRGLWCYRCCWHQYGQPPRAGAARSHHVVQLTTTHDCRPYRTGVSVPPARVRCVRNPSASGCQGWPAFRAGGRKAPSHPPCLPCRCSTGAVAQLHVLFHPGMPREETTAQSLRKVWGEGTEPHPLGVATGAEGVAPPQTERGEKADPHR